MLPDLRGALLVVAFVLCGRPRAAEGFRMGKTPVKYSVRLHNSAIEQNVGEFEAREGDEDEDSTVPRKCPWPIDLTKYADGESLTYEEFSTVHNMAFEVREFQLHVPPIAHNPPSLDPKFTRNDAYCKLKGKTPDGRRASAYMNGPIDLMDMVKRGEMNDFRHNCHGTSTEPGKSVLYTWMLERPADVFILNWSGLVTLGCREYVVIAARILLKLPSVDVTDRRTLLEDIANNNIPVWLYERCRYAMAYLEEPTDWIALLNYFTRNLEQLPTTEAPKVDKAGGDLEFVKNNTINGDPFNLVDYLAIPRYKLGLKADEMYYWRRRKHNEDDCLYDRESKVLGAFNAELTRMLDEERIEMRRNQEWKNLIMYRTNCAHLPESQRIHHEAFNPAIIDAINHHTQFFKMPVYLVSDFETSSEVRHQMEALGIKMSPLLKVIGSESGTLDTSISTIRDSLKIDRRIPIHYFDDRMKNLVAVLGHRHLKHVRTYFVDWGRSDYQEKLAALYHDGIKYIKTTKNLVELMCQFTTLRGREWTHGYRVVLPNEEHANYMTKWKNKWHEGDKSFGPRDLPVI
ncbi:membrane protein, hypothetical [Theileria equi strain WA]|uniref:Membrane protein, hypothetical n=1 Tax=Theileria equi strain WA TaxID=1537102 RepID=L1LA38_THEEQ|nr:membrane protein, hypothetical [Theileria equi strain WA]EKX72297.1 membrane protein, hypothetical [Theileria equi strain WA]|eukprot:XP_004831749.1 membrane protein, hypothetical [Theileria equi strain WA]